MKVVVTDLGILKQAEFTVGDLTVICGANNTGKTYATYALYGFLTFWNEAFVHSFIGNDDYGELMKQGSAKIMLDGLNKTKDNIIDIACKSYTINLPMVFGADERYFTKSSFYVRIEDVDFCCIDKRVQTKSPNEVALCDIVKVRNESFLTINIIANSEEIKKVHKEWFLHQINSGIQDILFSEVFPEPFIASIERTGAAMFQKELDIYRNWLLERVSNREKEINPFDLINSSYTDKRYALPVRRDVDFIRDLENVAKHESPITKETPEISKKFAELAGGAYRATREGIYYIPKKSKVKLTMGESASSVRSLLNLGMYILHIARPGDFLMIDEPELNLHPKNQRLMARLLAKLVNAGVKVFITTHSDYILKEFNTLIMLKNSDSTTGRRVMEKYDYQENELLDASRIKAYIAKKALVEMDGNSRRQKHNTFKQAPIEKDGIEIADFDETINDMNKIQEEIMFGELAV